MHSSPFLLVAALIACFATQADQPPPKRWAVIVVGLPGDDEHRDLFATTAQAWRTWFIDRVGMPEDQVFLLEDPRLMADTNGVPAGGKESLQQAFERIREQTRPEDSLWVLWLGHANYDGSQAFFHVRGPDPSDSDLALYLENIACREQVIWLTNSCAGWFLPKLSKPGRIVIAATAADFEFNETEFPSALATVLKRPAADLDSDLDGTLNVLELFAATVRETEARFAMDNRLPTEHAQLDDNGDGRGSELEALFDPSAKQSPASDAAGAAIPDRELTPAAPMEKRDGQLAAATVIPLVEKETRRDPTNSEQNENNE